MEDITTIGFWLELDTHFTTDLKRRHLHYMGALHAVEHAMKSLFPILALGNRTYVRGTCYPLHLQLHKGASSATTIIPAALVWPKKVLACWISSWR